MISLKKYKYFLISFSLLAFFVLAANQADASSSKEVAITVKGVVNKILDKKTATSTATTTVATNTSTSTKTSLIQDIKGAIKNVINPKNVTATTTVTTTTSVSNATTTPKGWKNINVPVKINLSQEKNKKASTTEVKMIVNRSSIRSVVADFLRAKNPVTKWTLDLACPTNVSAYLKNNASSTNSLCGQTTLLADEKNASKNTNIKETFLVKNLASTTQSISFTVKAYDQYGVVGSSTKDILVKPNVGNVGTTTGGTATTTTAKTFLNVPYLTAAGSDPKLNSLDIYLPKEVKELSGAPVAILVHGGGLHVGDKANKSFIENKKKFFNDMGYIAVSVNYRLSPEVQHPTHINDLDTAINWVEDNIKNYGGDSSKMVLLGHSAGAQLVLLAVTDEAKLKAAGVNPTAIKAAIALDTGSTNVPLKIASSTNSSSKNKKQSDQDFDLEKLYSAFTKDLNTQKDASPYYQITQGEKIAPLFLAYVASRKDTVEQREQFVEKLDELTETEYKLGLYEGYDHASINEKFGKSNDTVTKDAKIFLETLGLSK